MKNKKTLEEDSSPSSDISARWLHCTNHLHGPYKRRGESRNRYLPIKDVHHAPWYDPFLIRLPRDRSLHIS